MVAGALLVKEAGGTLIDPRDGSEFDYMSRGVLAASTPSLAKQIVDLKLSYQQTPRSLFLCCHLCYCFWEKLL